ncbi:MAG: CARDB domain-containing protein, partial [Candidatus Thermoplasmatota archaeon]|nr:CARDB domain-containing protein [Candidatus Thermoplasmatota archaeon]
MNVKEEGCRYLPVFFILLFIGLVSAIPLSGSVNISSSSGNPSPSRASGPDLEVSSSNISVLPASLKVGDTGFITAEVFNIGNEGASLVNVSFTVDTVPLGSPMIIPFISGNSSENITKMWQPAAPGNHHVRVEIDKGNLILELDETNNIASIEIFVATASNIPPSVNITHPRDREKVSGTVLISGTASDSPMDTNELTAVELSIDLEDYKAATGLNAWEYQWDTTLYSEGLHTINARSYDDEDISVVRSIEVIVDNDQSNEPPVANISSPRRLSNFSVNETIFFKGNTSSDPDLGPNELNFTWEMGDGSVVWGANINYSYSNIVPFITVTLRVYDGDQEDSEGIQIFINNTPPVAIAGGNRTAEIREMINFNGSRSYDPDEPFDQISKYQWNMGNGDVL